MSAGKDGVDGAAAWLSWPVGKFEEERRQHGDSDITSAILRKEDVPTVGTSRLRSAQQEDMLSTW